MADAFVAGACFFAVVYSIMTQITWYLMLSVSLEYKILGSQLKNMGVPIRTDSSHLKMSLAAQQKLFLEDLIVAIQTYDKINGYGSISVMLRKL